MFLSDEGSIIAAVFSVSSKSTWAGHLYVHDTSNHSDVMLLFKLCSLDNEKPFFFIATKLFHQMWEKKKSTFPREQTLDGAS